MIQSRKIRELVNDLRWLASPSAERLGEKERLDRFVKLANEAADTIERLESYMTG